MFLLIFVILTKIKFNSFKVNKKHGLVPVYTKLRMGICGGNPKRLVDMFWKLLLVLRLTLIIGSSGTVVELFMEDCCLSISARKSEKSSAKPLRRCFMSSLTLSEKASSCREIGTATLRDRLETSRSSRRTMGGVSGL